MTASGRSGFRVEGQAKCPPPIDLEAFKAKLVSFYGALKFMPARENHFADAGAIDKDLSLLENVRWARKEFVDRICAASLVRNEDVVATLRSEAAYQLAEFLFLLRARSMNTVEDIQNLVELHNQYIVELVKDEQKMARLGLSRDRLLEAIFTADTLPRLLQNWRERPGTFDQSNLARFLVGVMSTETCRKVVLACVHAGYLDRTRTPYGTIVVSSKGSLEDIFAACIRDLRLRLQ